MFVILWILIIFLQILLIFLQNSDNENVFCSIQSSYNNIRVGGIGGPNHFLYFTAL